MNLSALLSLLLIAILATHSFSAPTRHEKDASMPIKIAFPKQSTYSARDRPPRSPSQQPLSASLSNDKGPSSENQPQGSTTGTLSELLQQRPPTANKDEIPAFAEKFAAHPRVSLLNQLATSVKTATPETYAARIEALVKGWTELRKEEKGDYNYQKMHSSIKQHLIEVLGLDYAVYEAVENDWQREISRLKSNGRARRLRDLGKWKEYREAINRGRKRRRDGMRAGRGPLPFEEYLRFYHIDPKLPALELEEQTRIFRNEFGDRNCSAINALKEFLRGRNEDAAMINLVAGRRRRHLREKVTEKMLAARKSQTAARKDIRRREKEASVGKRVALQAAAKPSSSRQLTVQEQLYSTEWWHIGRL